MAYRILEINEGDRRRTKQFLELPVGLYKGNPNWIRPLDKDIEEVFDKKKNKFFRHGECTRFIAVDDNNKAVGRVAVFIDKKTANSHKQPTGGIGFFEAINSQEVANLLFDQCKKWLSERGMEAMDGPINFGERDRFWGLLLEGESPPNYGMFYHHQYYQELFTNYGFRLYFRQLTYGRPALGGVPEKIKEKADRIAKDPDYTFKHLELNKLPQFAEEFRAIYNKAWVKHAGVKGMTSVQAMAIMKRMKPILDPEIVWFAYYKGEPAAFFIMLPELNQLFRHLNGQFHLGAKLYFLILKWLGKCKKIFGVAFGVIPEHQGKGLESAVVMEANKLLLKRKKYDDFEMNWIGEFNPKMMRVAEAVGGSVRKIHGTYRYLFNPDAEWHDHPVIT